MPWCFSWQKACYGPAPPAAPTPCAAGSTCPLSSVAAISCGAGLTIVQSSELEAVTGLDRYQFARQFRAVYGTSPYRYSLMRRLGVARGWLRDAPPLAETAARAGFADQAHFTRAFKAAFGMTPGRYVKLCTARAGDGVVHPPPGART